MKKVFYIIILKDDQRLLDFYYQIVKDRMNFSVDSERRSIISTEVNDSSQSIFVKFLNMMTNNLFLKLIDKQIKLPVVQRAPK